MIEALAPAFVGPFVYFSGKLALSDDPRPRRRPRDLLEAPSIAQLVAHLRREAMEASPTALAAHWAKSYVATIAPASLAAILVLDHRLPVRFDDVELVLREDGVRPEAVILRDLGDSCASEDVFARTEDLIFGHIEPVFEALFRHARIGRRILWGDLAVFLAYFINSIAAYDAEHPGTLRCDPMPLLDRPLWPDGRKNPLFNPYRTVSTPEGPKTLRRTCCLSHQLGPGNQHCFDCPVLYKLGKTSCLTIAA